MTTDKKTENIEPPENWLGDRLKEAREKRGLSQEGLSRLTKVMDSEKLGISRTVLTGYEKGKFKPGTRELRILFETLALTPNWLILGRADPERIQSKYASEAEFESELLKAIRTLDSDSLNGIASLIFSASTHASNVETHLSEIQKLTAHVVEKMEDRMDDLQKKVASAEKKQSKAGNKTPS